MTNFLRLGVNEEEQSLADAVGKFSQAVLAPRAQELDESEQSVTCHVPQLAALGLMGMNLPESLGGPGVSPTGMLLALVEISKACAATSSMIGAHYLGTDALLMGGNAAQHQAWLPRAASGEWLAGFALTEPGGGSHPADLRTRAVREGDFYRLDGVKHYISNAAEAKFLVVFAKTDPQAGTRGITAFIVDADSAGLDDSEHIEVMAPHPLATLKFAQCRIPASAQLGELNGGFKLAMRTLDIFRASVAAAALGMARRALAEAISYAQNRPMFGQRLADFQLTQAKLGEMAALIDAGAMLTYRAAWLRDCVGTDDPAAAQAYTAAAAMAKMCATENAQRVIDMALQMHGGMGVKRGSKIESLYRDIRALRIYEGATEVQQLIIGKSVLRSFSAQA